MSSLPAPPEAGRFCKNIAELSVPRKAISDWKNRMPCTQNGYRAGHITLLPPRDAGWVEALFFRKKT